VTSVLVLGAGKRVAGAVLPALHCLGERYRVAGVLARSKRAITYGAGRSIETIDSLDGIDPDAIDLIVSAVSIRSVPRVLAHLVARGFHRAVLLHDTPVLQPAGIAAMRHFSAFRRAVISEDTLALPPLLLARRLVDDGAIGELRRIYFFHCGYKHHALASLKLLARSGISRIVSRKFSSKLRQKVVDFDNGITAVMYEPRDYAIGKFLIEGTRGLITDYDHPGATRVIGYLADGPIYRGLTLDGAPVPKTELDNAYLARIGTDIPEASLMNTMKLRGLMDLVDGALADHSPHHYRPAEGIADHVAIRIVDRTGYVPSQRLLIRFAELAQRMRAVKR
jgi:hypothetical protein